MKEGPSYRPSCLPAFSKLLNRPVFSHHWKLCGTEASRFVFCRADAFADIGEFSERVYATEEYWFSLKLKKWGRKRRMPFELLQNIRVVTSNRKFDQPHSLWAMLLTVFVPFSIFFRSTCRFWYKR